MKPAYRPPVDYGYRLPNGQPWLCCPLHGTLPPSKNHSKPRTLCPHHECRLAYFRYKTAARKSRAAGEHRLSMSR
jgi:hypothetical protein